MLLKAGESVKPHIDRVFHVRYQDGGFVRDANAGYWGRRLRIHVPVFTNPKVFFQSGKIRQRLSGGSAYIFDNSVVHAVENLSNQNRIHLVIDTVGGLELFGMMVMSQAKSVEDNVFPLYESWADAPVFDFMPASNVQTYLRYIKSLIPEYLTDDSKNRVADIFDTFLDHWQIKPSADMAFDLLLAPLACSELGNIRLQVESKFGMTLTQGIEPFARQLYFTCSGKFDQHESVIGPPCFLQQMDS